MRKNDPAQLVESAAEPIFRQISDLAKTTPPDVAKLLLLVQENLLNSTLRINQLGGTTKRRRADSAIRFHKAIGLTIGEFVLRGRLDVARRLLNSTNLDVAMIPNLVGLSRSVFFEHFKRRFGISPSQARSSNEDESVQEPPLVKPPSDSETAIEILSASTDEEIGGWLARAVCSLPLAQSQEILRHDLRFESAALFEALSARSRKEGRLDPERGIELAELAVASIEGSTSALGDDVARVLHARGLARLANARRLANDFGGAEQDLLRSEAILSSVEAKEKTAASGEWLCYRGSLRLFQRRFAEARDDLHRAVGVCKSTGQTSLEARARIQLAALSNYTGDSESARSHLLSAHNLVESELAVDLNLRLFVTTQLACIQAESDHAPEALALLPAARRLAAEVAYPKAEYQLDWIEAIARRAETSVAEKLLVRARQGFLSLSDIDYTAIVSLDLALLCEEQRRTAEVVSLASEALPALEALNLPEAGQALLTLHHSIAADHVRRELLVEIRTLVSTSNAILQRRNTTSSQ